MRCQNQPIRLYALATAYAIINEPATKMEIEMKTDHMRIFASD